MNKADMLAIILLVAFGGAGLFLGFTRGLGGFFGVFFGAQFAFQAANDPSVAGANSKCIWLFLGISLGIFIVGCLFYGSTHFTPIEAMDQVFGCILGLLTGWGVCFFIFHYQLTFHATSEFAAMVLDGKYAAPIYEIAPYTRFMQKMDRFRNPNII